MFGAKVNIPTLQEGSVFHLHSPRHIIFACLSARTFGESERIIMQSKKQAIIQAIPISNPIGFIYCIYHCWVCGPLCLLGCHIGSIWICIFIYHQDLHLKPSGFVCKPEIITLYEEDSSGTSQARLPTCG